MDWLPLASYITNGILVVIVALGIIVIRGMLASRDSMIDSYKRRDLTGREREDIRRRLLASGTSAIHPHEILDLIYTFRSVELGQYEDKDPYVPADPYDDIEEYIG